MQENLIGKTIMGYTVVEMLGAGAFGTVYKVLKRNESGQYIRALKHIVIPTEKQYYSVLNSMGGDVPKADSYFSQMLKNIVSEITILNDLSEAGVQHIVRYYENDIVTTDSPRRYDVYILMEYLTPIEEFIRNTEFLICDVVRLGIEILEGLSACHKNGVIHRDIKDDNIFVSDKGEFKIGDFGVSKILKDASRAESLKGTPNFLAPEVYLGKGGYTKSVDLYSLGIVLYRLLNYGRNPFLPCFPAQYFLQDEDEAFEKRMSGAIPDLPALGGMQIGQAVVKAISGRMERYQTADEFISALKLAEKNTPDDILDSKIYMVRPYDRKNISNLETGDFEATLGATFSVDTDRDATYNERSRSINKHLFETKSKTLNSDISEDITKIHIERGEEAEKNYKKSDRKSENIIMMSEKEKDKPGSPNKNAAGKIVFVIPAVIFVIGIILYFLIVPAIYGKGVSLLEWLFSGPQTIVDTLSDSSAVIPQINSIIGLIICCWGWLALLVISLFFAGKQLQKRPEEKSSEVLFTKQEAYLLLQNIDYRLSQIKSQRKDTKISSIVISIKSLEEKLYIESEFGIGKTEVIRCENEIASKLQFLSDAVTEFEKDDCRAEKTEIIKETVDNINFLLRRRTELKRIE